MARACLARAFYAFRASRADAALTRETCVLLFSRATGVNPPTSKLDARGVGGRVTAERARVFAVRLALRLCEDPLAGRGMAAECAPIVGADAMNALPRMIADTAVRANAAHGIEINADAEDAQHEPAGIVGKSLTVNTSFQRSRTLTPGPSLRAPSLRASHHALIQAQSTHVIIIGGLTDKGARGRGGAVFNSLLTFPVHRSLPRETWPRVGDADSITRTKWAASSDIDVRIAGGGPSVTSLLSAVTYTVLSDAFSVLRSAAAARRQMRATATANAMPAAAQAAAMQTTAARPWPREVALTVLRMWSRWTSERVAARAVAAWPPREPRTPKSDSRPLPEWDIFVIARGARARLRARAAAMGRLCAARRVLRAWATVLARGVRAREMARLAKRARTLATAARALDAWRTLRTVRTAAAPIAIASLRAWSRAATHARLFRASGAASTLSALARARLKARAWGAWVRAASLRRAQRVFACAKLQFSASAGARAAAESALAGWTGGVGSDTRACVAIAWAKWRSWAVRSTRWKTQIYNFAKAAAAARAKGVGADRNPVLCGDAFYAWRALAAARRCGEARDDEEYGIATATASPAMVLRLLQGTRSSACNRTDDITRVAATVALWGAIDSRDVARLRAALRGGADANAPRPVSTEISTAVRNLSEATLRPLAAVLQAASAHAGLLVVSLLEAGAGAEAAEAQASVRAAEPSVAALFSSFVHRIRSGRLTRLERSNAIAAEREHWETEAAAAGCTHATVAAWCTVADGLRSRPSVLQHITSDSALSPRAVRRATYALTAAGVHGTGDAALRVGEALVREGVKSAADFFTFEKRGMDEALRLRALRLFSIERARRLAGNAAVRVAAAKFREEAQLASLSPRAFRDAARSALELAARAAALDAEGLSASARAWAEKRLRGERMGGWARAPQSTAATEDDDDDGSTSARPPTAGAHVLAAMSASLANSSAGRALIPAVRRALANETRASSAPPAAQSGGVSATTFPTAPHVVNTNTPTSSPLLPPETPPSRGYTRGRSRSSTPSDALITAALGGTADTTTLRGQSRSRILPPPSPAARAASAARASRDAYSTSMRAARVETRARASVVAEQTRCLQAKREASTGTSHGKNASTPSRRALSSLLCDMLLLQQLRAKIAAHAPLDAIAIFFKNRDDRTSAAIALRVAARDALTRALEEAGDEASRAPQMPSGSGVRDVMLAAEAARAPRLRGWDLLRARCGWGYRATGLAAVASSNTEGGWGLANAAGRPSSALDPSIATLLSGEGTRADDWSGNALVGGARASAEGVARIAALARAAARSASDALGGAGYIAFGIDTRGGNMQRENLVQVGGGAQRLRLSSTAAAEGYLSDAQMSAAVVLARARDTARLVSSAVSVGAGMAAGRGPRVVAALLTLKEESSAAAARVVSVRSEIDRVSARFKAAEECALEAREHAEQLSGAAAEGGKALQGAIKARDPFSLALVRPGAAATASAMEKSTNAAAGLTRSAAALKQDAHDLATILTDAKLHADEMIVEIAEFERALAKLESCGGTDAAVSPPPGGRPPTASRIVRHVGEAMLVVRDSATVGKREGLLSRIGTPASSASHE